ncbi:VanZ family protein [Flavobacterium sp. xlx-214]|uniref:VanZ family protein n=1 Tax=unclassified Flavobacterium TaxID=196869 RepID=UPI0013D8D3AB|nr:MULTISPECIES: VanZ family protein [unclassified Flavobacterium]QMI83962.1 VanZ family protein [Flavobacterium sp. xlx-214]
MINLSNINEVQKISIPNIDKIVHFIFYTTSSFLWSWALLKQNASNYKLNLLLIILGLILFGLLVEFLQDVLPTKRSFEWLDVACNTLGVLFGTTIYLVYTKFKPHNS